MTTSEILLAVGSSNLVNRQELVVFNDGLQTIYVGPSGVTSSGTNKGLPIEPAETFNPPSGDGLEFYAVTASGSSDVIIQELA